MYYVVHKFPNLSRAMIHLGTHAHLVVDGKCRESFQGMKNMVVEEVCRTPIATTLVIVLTMNKTFLFCRLFNEDGEGHVELLKAEKLDQTLLKFTPLCFPDIHNFITSLKHRPSNLSSINYILKLKAMSSYDFIKDNCFLGQQVGQKVYLFKVSMDGVVFGFDLAMMTWKMHG
jgi:hypothetical protein